MDFGCFCFILKASILAWILVSLGKIMGLGCHLFKEVLKCKYFFLILFLDLLSKLSQLRDFLFVFSFWLCWVFIAAHGFSLVAVRGGFSPACLRLLQSSGSRHMGFCSCGCMGLLLHGMRDLLTPGIEPIWHADSFFFWHADS